MGNTSSTNPHQDANTSSTSKSQASIQPLGSGLDDNQQGHYTADGIDTLASSITKDLNPQTVGGTSLQLSRLWPGSGRMTRSYRVKMQVPRYNNNNVASAVDSDSLPFTIELTCKSFIVKSHTVDSLTKALHDGEAELKRLRTLVSNPSTHPHILSYARWIIGTSSTNTLTRPIHLLRQHVHSSLSDRLLSRPFLTTIEKNWITYQLLQAIQSLHNVHLVHGHITTENVLLTSWNWVYISDVGCQHFKPVRLPDDDPGLWIHWFEGRDNQGGGMWSQREEDGERVGNGEKKCCLAPERFYTRGKVKDGDVAMVKGKESESTAEATLLLLYRGTCILTR